MTRMVSPLFISIALAEKKIGSRTSSNSVPSGTVAVQMLPIAPSAAWESTMRAGISGRTGRTGSCGGGAGAAAGGAEGEDGAAPPEAADAAASSAAGRPRMVCLVSLNGGVLKVGEVERAHRSDALLDQMKGARRSALLIASHVTRSAR